MNLKDNAKLFYRIFTTPTLLRLFLGGLYNIIKKTIMEVVTGNKIKTVVVNSTTDTELGSINQPEKVTETIEQILEKYADKNCHKCYGRGYIGIHKTAIDNFTNGKYIPCKCFVENHNEYINKQREIERNKLKN